MKYKMINKSKIPMIGFGTWKISDLDAEDSVYQALQVGYRHIDTASIYNNERGVGKGIQKSEVDRKDIFLTTKVWLETSTYNGVLEEFDKSCNLLNTDYIDLYLIHWPTQKASDQWKALEYLYDLKKVKSIGVCNFNQHHLDDLNKHANYKPSINQIEMHPLLTQKALLTYNKQHDILTEAWSPLMKGKIIEYTLLKDLAKKYNKSEAQITLRWHLQNDVIVIPKTVHLNRMKENLDVFDFELSTQDMMLLNSLNKDERIGGNPDVYAREKFNC
jgi:diketogulonate reductase-like aldo/keto reductase